MTGGASARYAVIYDGHCSVCRALARKLARMDRQGVFEIVTSHAPGVRRRFAWIPAAAFEESLQLVRMSDSRTWEGSAAVETIITELRGGRWFSWIFALPLARPIAEKFYRWFARNRGKFGCGAHCSMQINASEQRLQAELVRDRSHV